MRPSTIVLWGLVGVLVGLAVAASCATSDPPACDPVQCRADCRRSHEDGMCDRGACICIDGADADADADGDADADVDTGDRPDTEVRDDGRDETEVRDEAGGESSEGGEAKSGCDPLVCFLACGGTCTVGGECSCESPAP